MEKIYLDYNASTPIAPEVTSAMQPYLLDHYGNPSSQHWASHRAAQGLEHAREQVASLLGCTSDEIFFTSGGSEANNHALKGVYFALKGKGNHIITTKIEHPAILGPCRFLEQLGAKITYLGVDRYGQVSLDDIEQAMTKETILISIMHANNEVGTIQPIEQIAQLCQSKKILLHTDAAQSVGKIHTKVNDLGVDMLSIAGHKLYAPKGVGALYIRRNTRIEPIIHGAGHERGLRAGTENVLLIAGLGIACQLVEKDLEGQGSLHLRNYFEQELKRTFEDRIIINGHPKDRLPNTLSVSFIGEFGSSILEKVPAIAASTGSACHSGETKMSAVLKEMNLDPYIGLGTIRFSLGRYSTREQIDRAVYLLKEALPVVSNS